MKLDIVNGQNEKVGDLELNDEIFGGRIKTDLIWESVVQQNAADRRGTHATKNRALVSGSGKKPWRQKGTGRARQGSTRAAQWRGGGSVFGPRAERNFKEDVPKKVKRLARRSAYNARAEEGRLMLVEALDFDAPKTKRITALLDGAELMGNVLILTDGHRPSGWKSVRNLRGVEVRPFGEESAYDLLWADSVILEASALERAGEVAHA